MDEIVKKVQEVQTTAGQNPPPGGGMEITVRVQAQAMGGQKKRAEVWTEAGGRPGGSRWQMLCDESVRVGGEDTAPPPLNYFSAGIAF